MLRTLVAALVVEAAMLVLLYAADLPGPALLAWYRQLGPSALAMDVLSMYVGVHAAQLLAGENSAIPYVLGIQVAHDLAFGYFVASVPRGASQVIDLFKDYARPAILGYDAAIVLSVLAADVALELFRPPLALVGAVAAYASLMVVHSF